MKPVLRRVWVAALAAALVVPMLIALPALGEPSPPSALFAWGADDAGQVGDGEPSGCFDEFCQQEPVPVAVDTTFQGDPLPPLVAIDATRFSALALDDTGRLWNWGSSSFLAHGLQGRDAPEVVDLGGPFVDVGAGWFHSMAIEGESGRVWAWGANGSGQLGRGFFTAEGTETEPAEVLVFQDPEAGGPVPLESVVAVTGGGWHSLALDAQGQVWAWGDNAQGQLGNGDVDRGSRPYAAPVITSSGDPLTGIVAIAAGQRHSIAVTEDGQVLTWGDNRQGQLALGDVGGTFDTPQSSGQLVDFTIVRAAGGDSSSFFLDEFGQVLSVGDDNQGERGDNETFDDPSGTPTDVLLPGPATRIASKANFALALMDDGSVQAWGDNSQGMLGDGGESGEARPFPGPVANLDNVAGLGTGVLTAYALQPLEPAAPPIENLALRVDPVVDEVADPNVPDEGPIGIPDVDLAGVDIGDVQLFSGNVQALPLRASPLRASPLRASPLRASPLRASPLRASPLRASPLRASPLRASPLRASALPPMPLSQVPLLFSDGWAGILAGDISDPALLDALTGATPKATPLAGLPLQSVMLQQVFDLPQGTYPQIDVLTLGDVDITSTPLRASSIQTFLFAGPSLDELSSTADWCGELAAHGFSCTDHGITEATSTLVDLHFAGAPVDDLVFLPGLPVDSADLNGDDADPTDDSPAYLYDLAFLDPGSPVLGSILVSDLPAGIVDCTSGFDCNDPGATLGDALHAIQETEVPAIADDAILGVLLEHFGAGLTLADVVRMLVDPAKLVYADMPLAPLVLSTPVDRNLVQYTASADVACTQTDDMILHVAIPQGFRYQQGSSRLTVGGSSSDPGDPLVSGTGIRREEETVVIDAIIAPSSRTVLTWSLQQDCAENGVEQPVAPITLSFNAQPWIELGTKTAGVALTTRDGSQSVLDTAPFGVEDAWEPTEASAGAATVAPGELVLAHLGEGDTTDTFQIVGPEGPLERGTLVTAVLGHLPADFDLGMSGPSSAPLRASPLRASPLRASPLRASPIEDDGLPGDGSGLVLEPDRLQDVPRFDIDLSGARQLLSFSGHDGFESEVVSAVVTADTAGDPVTLNVSGYLGATSDLPYTIQVFVEPPPELNCTPTTAFDSGGAIGTLPDVGSVDPNARTLVLINEQRLGAQFGQQAVADIRAAFDAIADDPEAGPFVILPVDGDADVRSAYADWDADPCEPELGNDIVREIASVMDPYLLALPELRFAVVVGDHYHIPSYATPDTVTLANQRDYYSQLVFDGVDNPLSAAAGLGYVHTDHAYGDLDPIGWLDHELLVPELAVGRLVETPDDIIGALQRYAAEPFIDIDSTLTTGYDFLLDGAADIDQALQDAGSPTSSAALVNDSWTKADVLADLNAASPDVAAINGHYDHSRFLTAAGDASGEPASEIVSSTEMLAQGLSEGMLAFTVGCNAGVNVPALAALGTSVEGTERLLDFAEMTASLDGTLFGNLGFGYGDTDLNLYSERLMTNFAGNLDGSMTIGQAAVAAQHGYLSELGLPGVYDYKVLVESTMYGLPFVRVGETGQVADRHDNLAAPPPDTSALTFDTFSRLRATTFDFSFDYLFRDLTRGDYFQALDPTTNVDPEPEPLLISHYRPVQPEVSVNLPEADEGTEVGDLLITGLTSTEQPLVDPYFVRPTVDLEANEPEPLVVDTVFPASLGNVNPEGNLILHTGQYRSDATTPGSGTQILFDRIQGEVLYPDAPGEPPLRPAFTRVEGVDVGSTAFLVEVSPAELVLVMYKIPGEAEWGSLLLNQTAPGSGVWTGFTPDEVEEFFVQAVNGGVVGSARGKGLDFQPSQAIEQGDGFTLDISGTAGSNGWFVSPASVVIQTTDGSEATYEVSVDAAGYQPAAGEPPTVSVDGTGLHLVRVRRSDGDQASAFVPIDLVAPTVTVPFDGQLVTVGAVIEVACDDVGSGVASCTLDDGTTTLDTSPGEHPFTVTAVDHAGHQTTVSGIYLAQYLFDGFLPPVKNPPDLNVVESGSTVPLKFVVSDLNGIVDDPGVVTSVTSVTLEPCPDDPPKGRNAGEPTPTGDPDDVAMDLRFDEEAQQFILNWMTDATWEGCRELRLELDDGSVHTAWFRFVPGDKSDSKGGGKGGGKPK